MASTPHAPPKHKNDDDDQPKAAATKAPEVKAAEPPAPKYPTLTKESAWSLFYNGHRIAKQGDPPEKWISMSRAADGTATVITPMTPELEQAVKSGEYYLAEGEPPPVAPAGPPTVVDTPHVSAMGALASCTMGNWNGEPTSYVYAWQRDGMPISSAASAPDYTMVAADSGKPIGCIVSATNAAGTTAAPLSNTVIGP